MAQIAGAAGPAANSHVTRQANTQNLTQQRIQERARTQGASTNAGQNTPPQAGQAQQAAGPANQQNSPRQNVGRNVNIVV